MSVWEFPWLCHEGRQAGNPQITFVSSKSNTMSSRSKLTATLRVYLALELLGSSNCIDGQNLSIKKKCVWIEAKMRGSQWPMVWGWSRMDGKKTSWLWGKPLFRGRWPQAWCRLLLDWRYVMGLLAALWNILCSVCGPIDGKQAGCMFSRGPGGAQDQREEILQKLPAWQWKWNIFTSEW